MIRRIGPTGVRRSIRQSMLSAVASPDSLEALWADYGASAGYFFQGGVGRIGDTWTDRVGAYAALDNTQAADIDTRLIALGGI